MILHNCIGFETRYGYRSFELFEGDLTSEELRADLLVISAFAGEYYPAHGTVFSALRNRWGIDLQQFPRLLNTGASLGFILTERLPPGNFQRILVLDIVGATQTIDEALRNLFPALALIDAKGIPTRTIALPLLGAGRQGIPAEEAMRSLLPAIRKVLEHAIGVERIMLVERDPARAKAISDGLDHLTGRMLSNMAKHEVTTAICIELGSEIARLVPSVSPEIQKLLNTLQEHVSKDRINMSAISLTGRQLVEQVLQKELGPATTEDRLFSRISQMRDRNLAPWMISYMHMLRYFGNVAAHSHSAAQPLQRPAEFSEGDVQVCLLAIKRLLVMLER